MRSLWIASYECAENLITISALRAQLTISDADSSNVVKTYCNRRNYIGEGTHQVMEFILSLQFISLLSCGHRQVGQWAISAVALKDIVAWILLAFSVAH